MTAPISPDPDRNRQPDHPADEQRASERGDHTQDVSTRPMLRDATAGPAARSAAPPPADAEGRLEPTRLVVTRGPQAGTAFPLGERQVLGRSSACAIPLDHVTVSRRHAEIYHDGRQHVLSDTGSLNGTYLNRHPVEEPTALGDGDEIRIGIFRLTVHISPPA